MNWAGRGSCNGPKTLTQPSSGATWSVVVEWKGRTSSGNGWLGSFDPVMEALRGAIVAGERKAVTSCRLQSEEVSAACLEALIR